MEGVVLSPFYLFHLNITCFPSWEQLLKERAANRGTLFPVFFLRHYFILPFEEGFVSFHFDAKHFDEYGSCYVFSDDTMAKQLENKLIAGILKFSAV